MPVDARTELDRDSQLPRFNMPLELGIFMGAKRYGPRLQREKRLLIFDTEKYRYQKLISDIAGMDIHAHGGEPETALVITRNWLTNVSRRQLPGEMRLLSVDRQFRAGLTALAERLDLDPVMITYADFERIVAAWLLDAAPRSR